MRAEIKSKLESKYLKMENETRLKCFRAVKELSTVEVEKWRIEKNQEANQKIKIVQQEYEVLSKTLRQSNKISQEKLSQQQEILKEVR